MSMTIIDNFSLKGKSFMDGRQGVATKAALKAIPETDVPDGFIAYCAEDKQWYKFLTSNSVDATTGKWRTFGGDGATAISAQKGKAGGLASLGADGKVPSSQLPYIPGMVVFAVTGSSDNSELLDYCQSGSEDVVILYTETSGGETSTVALTVREANDSTVVTNPFVHYSETKSGRRVYDLVELSVKRSNANFQGAYFDGEMLETGSVGSTKLADSSVTTAKIRDKAVTAAKLGDDVVAKFVEVSSKGKANGVASLDASGLVPSSQLPGYVDDVVEIAGFVSGVTATAVANFGQLPAGTMWHYDSANKRMVLQGINGGVGTNTSYSYWAAGEDEDSSLVASVFGRVCSPGGAPLKGKIYVDTSTNRQWRWSGSEMIELGKSLSLGAAEGSGNVVTEIKVKDGVITPVKGDSFASQSYADNLSANISSVELSLEDKTSDLNSRVDALEKKKADASIVGDLIQTVNGKADSSVVTKLGERVEALEGAEPEAITTAEIDALFV